MMNTNELYEQLWRDETTSSYVLGVVPSKALKFIHADRRTRCYIVHLQNKKHSPRDDDDLGDGDGHSGGHWLVFTVHGLKSEMQRREDEEVTRERNPQRRAELLDQFAVLEIFDSQGPRDVYNEEITNFISKFGNVVIHSQFLSNYYCGFYTLLYTYYRSRAFAPKVVLEILTAMKECNIPCLCRQLFESSKPVHVK